jgi:hypothetical protein
MLTALMFPPSVVIEPAVAPAQRDCVPEIFGVAPEIAYNIPNAPDRLNIGGFSDACFSTIAAFLESNDPDFWVKKINQIDLTPTSNAKVIL